MNYKGTVTNIDTQLCKFTLDDKIDVYAAYIFTNTSTTIQLPAMSEQVVVTNVLFNRNRIFLQPDSKIMCRKFYTPLTQKSAKNFIKLIKMYNLKPADILKILKTINDLNQSDPFTSEFMKKTVFTTKITIKDMIYILIRYVSRTLSSNISNLSKPTLKEFIVKMPRDYNMKKVDSKKIIHSIYWNFGVMHAEKNEFLIGYLHINDKAGFTIISDDKYFIVCVILPENPTLYSAQISFLLNNFVVFRNYCIFSENYKNFGHIQYVIVNVNDVLLLSTNRRNIEPRKIKTRKGIAVHFKVKHKSSVILNSGKLQCLLHCNITRKLDLKTKSTKECLDGDCIFRLTGKVFKMYPMFNENDEFIVASNNATFITEISTLKGESSFLLNNERIPVFTIPQNAKLQLLRNTTNFSGNAPPVRLKIRNEIRSIQPLVIRNSKLLSVFEVDDLLKTQPNKKQLVCFEGIVVRKRFIDPLPYASESTPHANRAFGTPGRQVHQLILKQVPDPVEEAIRSARLPETLMIYASEDGTTDAADRFWRALSEAVDEKPLHAYVYFHNWQFLQCPLALVPGTRVAVRYVLPQKGKYFKPTFMSSVQVVEHVPPVKFNTCFEYVQNTDWGPKCFLGLGETIPTDCVCWGPVHTMQITHLTVHHTCTKCDSRIHPGDIECCGSEFFNLNMLLILVVHDEGGESDVLTKDDDILRIFLNRSPREWNLWRKAMRYIRNFTLKSDDCEDRQSPDGGFAFSFKLMIESWSRNELHEFDLKCRKLDKNKGDRNENPKWYCIEARVTD